MKRSWYWKVIEGQLLGGSLPRTEAMILLSSEAGASQDQKVQLENVLQWLQLVGLIRLDDKMVVATEASGMSQASQSAAGSTAAAEQLAGGEEMDSNGKSVRAEPKDLVLSFSVDFKLSASDLATLSADQIRALFEAVGLVASLTTSK
jgi:hypothetical protein